MEYTQEHLLGAYIQNTMELEDMDPDQQESKYADEIREDLDEIWDIMDEFTQRVAVDVTSRLETFSLVRQCTQRHADIMARRREDYE